MEHIYTFHKTVIGHLHIIKEIPCEDYSDSYSEENGRYHIAIVADGHGSKECFRSAFGSEAVTKIAMDCLKEFAEVVLTTSEIENKFYQELFSSPRYRQTTIKCLTDTIIAKWHDYIYNDYKNNPPTQEETEENIEKYKENINKIPHIYGTTLIAALLLPQCLIILHQGDGRCEVFYEDGIVDQPVPWDKRCEDTTTTSMCDFDVVNSIRNCVIDTSKRNVIACYLGSDGVEDAYRDTYESIGDTHTLMSGVHTFYKNLTCQISEKDINEFKEYLDTMLPEFSEKGLFSHTGSGDDVSVAGIVDINAIKKFIEPFQIDIKRYSLEEDLFWKEDELRGKTRKHGILQKRYLEAKAEFNNKKKKNNITEELLYLEKRVLETKNIFEDYDEKYQAISKEILQIKNNIEALYNK